MKDMKTINPTVNEAEVKKVITIKRVILGSAIAFGTAVGVQLIYNLAFKKINDNYTELFEQILEVGKKVKAQEES